MEPYSDIVALGPIFFTQHNSLESHPNCSLSWESPCLLLSNILCNGRMTVVENPLLGDICAGASFGGLHIKVLWTLVSRGLWGWEFSFLWTNAWECHSGWSGSCTYHFGKETAQFSAEWLSASLCAHPPCACTHTLTARVLTFAIWEVRHTLPGFTCTSRWLMTLSSIQALACLPGSRSFCVFGSFSDWIGVEIF